MMVGSLVAEPVRKSSTPTTTEDCRCQSVRSAGSNLGRSVAVIEADFDAQLEYILRQGDADDRAGTGLKFDRGKPLRS
jgi:hypothetical protein